jgi:hypothetical protein
MPEISFFSSIPDAIEIKVNSFPSQVVTVQGEQAKL